MHVHSHVHVCVCLSIWGLEGRESLQESILFDFLGRADLKTGLWNGVDTVRDYGDI